MEPTNQRPHSTAPVEPATEERAQTAAELLREQHLAREREMDDYDMDPLGVDAPAAEEDEAARCGGESCIAAGCSHGPEREAVRHTEALRHPKPGDVWMAIPDPEASR